MVSISDWKPEQRHYVLEIGLIVWIDVVDLDATCLVVLEISDNLIGIGLTPVTRFACSIGDATQRASVVVRACVGGLAGHFLTDIEMANMSNGF